MSTHLLILYCENFSLWFHHIYVQVSIMQIASEKMVFVFDLIKLYNDVPDILDNCLTRILQSSSILKLGKWCLYLRMYILINNTQYDVL